MERKLAAVWLSFVLFYIESFKAQANQTSSTVWPPLVNSTSPVFPSSNVNSAIRSSKVVPLSVSSENQMTRTMSMMGSRYSSTPSYENKDDEKLESYVVIIIAASVAVVVFIIVIVLVMCVFRRRRIQRLERERNLSYNNMNYESTVKFRLDENGEPAVRLADTSADDPFTVDDLSPKKKSNNNRGGEYEVVDLPGERNNERQPRKYENVTPQKSIKDNNSSTPGRPYENVTPVTLSGKDKPVVGQYEQVVLSTPPDSKKQKKSDKYYENVDPPHLR